VKCTFRKEKNVHSEKKKMYNLCLLICMYAAPVLDLSVVEVFVCGNVYTSALLICVFLIFDMCVCMYQLWHVCLYVNLHAPVLYGHIYIL